MRHRARLEKRPTRIGLAQIIATCLVVLFSNGARAELPIFSSTSNTIKVTAGSEKIIRRFWDLQEDCSVRRGFNIRIAQPPENGVARLERTNSIVDQKWTKGADTARRLRLAEKCMGKTVPVIILYYRARDGFVGADKLFVIRTSADGKTESHREFWLRVR